MNFLPGLSLVFDILFHCLPIPSITDCSKVETVAPEFTAPQFFFEERKLFKQFSARDRFEYSDHIRTTIFRWEATEDMDVVLIIAKFFKFNVIAFTNFLCEMIDGEWNILGEQRFPILNGKDQVVVSIVGVVPCFLESHASSLPWKPRVSKPSSKVIAASREESATRILPKETRIPVRVPQ